MLLMPCLYVKAGVAGSPNFQQGAEKRVSTVGSNKPDGDSRSACVDQFRGTVRW